MIALPCIILGSGIFILLTCLPLMLGKVPMNPLYGIRIPAAFESQARWYAVNAHGSRIMTRWTLPIVAAGIVGFFLPASAEQPYGWACALVTLVSMAAALVQILRWSRKSAA